MSNRDILPPDLKDAYEMLLSKFTDQRRLSSFLNLVQYAEEKTDYLIAPASSKFHMSCKHGLLLHSISVTSLMLNIRETSDLFKDIPESSIILTGLFHDFGKVGNPSKNIPYYEECKPTPKQEAAGYGPSQPYKYNQKYDSIDSVYLTHADNSLYLMSPFIVLTREEYQAIRVHDGDAVQSNSDYIMKGCLLQNLLNTADTRSARFLDL